MDKISILFAKIAGINKSFRALDWGRMNRIQGSRVNHLIEQFDKYRRELIALIPELYSDLPLIELPISEGINTEGDQLFSYHQIIPIIDNLDYILEVRANYRIGEKMNITEKSKRIFISHGQSKEWYKLQAYIERDLKQQTLELAQEANLGRTVLQKLNDESNRCCIAVIVMTGDDIMENEVRARENVMHEIGFFQGKYGLQNIILLHEEGVNIPSNIHGLVYIPFPKNTVEATFGALTREITAQLS